MTELPLRAPMADATLRERLDSAQQRRRAADAAELRRLVEAAGAGDELAWSELHRRFSAMIAGVARRYRLPASDAEDVVQATWLRLFGNIGSIRDPERIGAWLRTTAQRESLRVATTASREQPSGVEVLSEEHAAPMEELVATSLRRQAFHDAVQALPGRHRRLICALVADRERSYAEIAAEADIPIGSIGPTRARCITRLRRDRRLAAAMFPED